MQSKQTGEPLKLAAKVPPHSSEKRLLFALLLVNAFALLPLLRSGYVSDDSLNSAVRGGLLEQNMSLLGLTVHIIGSWLTNVGRFYPLSGYAYTVFYVLTNLYIYKCFILLLILLSIYAYARFVRTLTSSAYYGLMAIAVLPAIIQFRGGFDPILAFCGLVPVLSIMLFACLTRYVDYLRSGEKRLLMYAVGLYAAAALTYELSYTIIPLFFLIALLIRKQRRAAVRATIPFAGIVAALAILSLVLRASRHIPLTGGGSPYVPNWSVPAIARAYVLHVIGAVPFSYSVFDPHSLFRGIWRSLTLDRFLMAVLFGCIVYVVCRVLFCHGDRCQSANVHTLKPLAWTGLSLVLLSPVLISLSPKYQAITAGDENLPVYLQCFGISALITWSSAWVSARLVGADGKWRAAARFAGIGGLVVSSGWMLIQNQRTVDASNEIWRNPRILEEDAIRAGLFAPMEDKATLLVARGERVAGRELLQVPHGPFVFRDWADRGRR